MSNIPTDLLRTLVAVVDEHSFTRAAHALGVTQPAVSAQIKRLQTMLGGDLFDRSGHELKLTRKGEQVVSQARRMLAINDQILQLAEPAPAAHTIRLGMPEDFFGGQFPALLAMFRKQWPGLRFSVQHGPIARHLRELRQGQLDLVLGASVNGTPEAEPRHCWLEDAVWLRGRATALDPSAPVPLVAFREDWLSHQIAVNALTEAGRDTELVFTAPTITALASAVGAGLGIMVLARSRVRLPDIMIWEDAPLPRLPKLNWGIYVREGAEHSPLVEIADATAEMVTERVAASARREEPPQPIKTIGPRKRVAS
jgi:DNA-binding transcriptional LysR family regulator